MMGAAMQSGTYGGADTGTDYGYLEYDLLDRLLLLLFFQIRSLLDPVCKSPRVVLKQVL
jgi:hypothetical protein